MEAFCAEHSVRYDEVLYEWPADMFIAFYKAYARRKVADELSSKRAMEVAAVWGNSNLDGDKIQEIQESIDKQYSQAIAGLYEELPEQNEKDIDEDDPFWQAMKRGVEKHKI